MNEKGNIVKSFRDGAPLTDSYEVSEEEFNNIKPDLGLKGKVVMRDDNGDVILEQFNKIVLRGRVFALEKIFDIKNTLDEDFNTDSMDTKKVCIFKAGKGGAVENDHFNVLSVESDARDMNEELPFKIDNMDEAPKGYFDRRPLKDDPDTFGYYAKEIDSITWGKPDLSDEYYDEDLDEAFVKLTLKIDKDDFVINKTIDENRKEVYERATFINEIGLCIANPVKTEHTHKMKNIELFSKICFESEPLFNSTKTITIDYYIYA